MTMEKVLGKAGVRGSSPLSFTVNLRLVFKRSSKPNLISVVYNFQTDRKLILGLSPGQICDNRDGGWELCLLKGNSSSW